MRVRTLGLTGQRCPCGAAAETRRSFCRKCRARARWMRRKARPGDGDD
jgi:hypothetical protein